MEKLSLKSIWVIKGFATPRLRNSIGGRTLAQTAATIKLAYFVRLNMIHHLTVDPRANVQYGDT